LPVSVEVENHKGGGTEVIKRSDLTGKRGQFTVFKSGTWGKGKEIASPGNLRVVKGAADRSSGGKFSTTTEKKEKNKTGLSPEK